MIMIMMMMINYNMIQPYYKLTDAFQTDAFNVVLNSNCQSV